MQKPYGTFKMVTLKSGKSHWIRLAAGPDDDVIFSTKQLPKITNYTHKIREWKITKVKFINQQKLIKTYKIIKPFELKNKLKRAFKQ